MSVKPPRLYQRDHGVFYLRVITPKSLQASTGKRETWHSLRTKDPTEARICALSYALELEKAKAGMSKKKSVFDFSDKITAPLKITTPDGFTVDFDHNDPKETSAAQEFIKAHTPKQAPTLPPPVTQAQRDAWHAQDLANLREREAGFRQAEAERDAIIEASRKPKGRRFAPLVEEYFKLHALSVADRTVKKYRSAINTFLDYSGHDVTVDEITKERWYQFQIYLATDDPATGRTKITPRSIDTYTTAVGVVLKMALGENHPLRGQTLFTHKQKAKPQGKSFTPDELVKIFDPDRLKLTYHPTDAWGNLLALFTGARLSEIFQLRLADVRVVNGVRVLDLHDEVAGNSLKNQASRRLVPLHQTIIDLGFLDYLNDVRALPNASDVTLIFPFLTKYEQGYGDVPSQRFTELLKDLKIHQPRIKVFHSFRHTLNQRLKIAGVSTEYRCMFLGHENDDVNTMVYGDQTPIQVVRDKVLPALAFEEIQWHKIKLDRQRIKEALARLTEGAGRKKRIKENK